MDQIPPAIAGPPAPNMRWFFFGLSGRIGRAPFVLGVLFQMAVYGVIISQLAANPEESARFSFWVACLFIFSLLCVWQMVAMAVKRLHDMNIPGAVVLCLFVPAVSIIAFLVMCVWWGTAGPNDYGETSNRPKD